MTFTTLNLINSILENEYKKLTARIDDSKLELEEIYAETGCSCWTPDEELGCLGAYYRKTLKEDREKRRKVESALNEFLAHEWR